MNVSKRSLTWIVGTSILAVVVLASGMIYLRISQSAYSFNGGTWDPPREAPELVMTDQYGQEFRLEDHQGKVVLVFFGYTHCPDYCPSTLFQIIEVLNFLGDDAENVEVAFVSVDPKRDTPERLQEYLQFYNPEFYGLTASEEDTDRIKLEWGTTGNAEEPEEGQDYYLVSHTTSLFAVSPDGKLAVTWAYGTDAELISEDVKHLLDD